MKHVFRTVDCLPYRSPPPNDVGWSQPRGTVGRCTDQHRTYMPGAWLGSPPGKAQDAAHGNGTVLALSTDMCRDLEGCENANRTAASPGHVTRCVIKSKGGAQD
ncbi:hypothetical protein PMIN06_008337 [Paraphaeosphaeria minitans]